MLAKLEIRRDRRPLRFESAHRLVVFDAGEPPRPSTTDGATDGGCATELLHRVLKRRRVKAGSLAKTPLSATLDDGGLIAWVAWDAKGTAFDRQTALRKAVAPLLADGAASIDVVLVPSLPQVAADETLYVCWVNGATLPSAKADPDRRALHTIRWAGVVPDSKAVAAVAEGNVLARRLTAMAPNLLTPRALKKEAADLSRRHGFAIEVYGLGALRKLGCGAFLSVAEGSADEDAAIVHLRYEPRGARGRLALVGKGICFDTGGYNLKPARAMAGMHEDMAGAAVVLGVMHAARRLKLPLAIDGWLAVSRNRIAPGASVPGDVVRASNGKTIEIVHTDAEGRMVLADTLVLAVKKKPDLVVDFATLTGSMVTALGCRQSGVLSPDARWVARAVDCGARAGERLVGFPVPEDYGAELESEVADIKQCTPGGEADHIHAAHFLRQFVGEQHWLHFDLSAVRCKGGLGAIAGDLTGFGVATGVALVRDMIGTHGD